MQDRDRARPEGGKRPAPPRTVAAGAHDRLTRTFSVAMLVIGAALIARAVGGATVYAAVLGVLFIAAGAGRLYVQLRRARAR